MSDVFCGSCGDALVEPLNADSRTPCPRCGSLGRYFPVLLEDKQKVGDFIVGRAYAGRMSKRKGFMWEASAGAELSKRLGRLVKKSRLIDKVADRYAERVVDPVTGQVLRDVDHPLSEHAGRGAAKPKPSGD